MPGCEFKSSAQNDKLKEWIEKNCAEISSLSDIIVNQESQYGQAVDSPGGYVNSLSENNTQQLLDKYARNDEGLKHHMHGMETSNFGTILLKDIYVDIKTIQRITAAKGDISQVLESAPGLQDKLATTIPALKTATEILNAVQNENFGEKTDQWDIEHGAGLGWNDVHGQDGNTLGSLKYLETQLKAALATAESTKAQAEELAAKKTEYDGIIAEEAAKIQDAIDTEKTALGPGSVGVAPTSAELEALNKRLADLKGATFEEVAGQIVAEGAMSRTFREQCLLLANVYKLAAYKVSVLEKNNPKKLPYINHTDARATSQVVNGVPVHPEPTKGNACIMAQREPWGFMNQLVQDPSFNAFFDIHTEVLSQLAPMIRLYKIEFANEVQDQTEFTFATHYNSASDLENILNNKNKRGFGVGLKSFNFSYEGSNPFAVKKSIKAKLVIFASSFDDLLADRTDPNGRHFRYADLALKTGGNLKDFLDRTNQSADSLISNITKLNFRLKAVVGWQMPNLAESSLSRTQRTPIETAIQNSFVTLNLTPTIHEFDIDDMGRVVFTINYLAYIEDFFDQPNFNIFANSKNQVDALKRKIEISAYEEGCGNPEQIAEMKEAQYKKVKEEKFSNLNSIMTRLLDKNKVLFVPVKYDELNNFNESGPFFNFKLAPDPVATDEASIDETKAEISKALETLGEKLDQLDLSKTSMSGLVMSESEYIKFFYLSDLIDVVLEGIEASLTDMAENVGKANPPSGVELTGDFSWKEMLASEQERLNRLLVNFRHFRVVLGPIELYDFATGEGKNTRASSPDNAPPVGVNLGDLPISVTYFMDWLTDKVLKRDSVVYTLSTFLNDLLNGLVRNFLNEDRCHDLNIKQKTRVFQSVVTSYNGPVKGPNETATQMLSELDELTRLIFYDGMGRASRLNMDEVASFGDGMLGGRSQPILNVMGERDSPIVTRQPSQEYNFLVYYAGRVQPHELMTGTKDTDSKNGIYHYMIGKPNGIVKNIQLIKTDSPGLKEVRFEQEGYDGLAQLREVYDANITCYGSPNVVPGTYIYIDPLGFAPNAIGGVSYSDSEGNPVDKMMLTRYGIGGYYMVIKAENSLGPGEFSTKITAKWVAELSSPSKSDGGLRKVRGPRPTKCRTGG